MGFRDPYLFIREFEEVCTLIHMPRVPNDVVRTKSTPLTLNDDANRWMHGLKVGSIISWDSFVDIFLKRCFPTSKIIRIRNEIILLSNLNMSLFGSIRIGSRSYLPNALTMA